MRNKPHSIGKQLFEVEYFSDSNGLVFRQEFTELVKRSLLSVIEEVLDELSPKDATLRVEKVEIELTQVVYPFDEWSIKHQLKNCLRNELNFKIVSIRHQGKNSVLVNDSILSNANTREELLFYFLQYGFLPWWQSESNVNRVSVTDLIQELIHAEPRIVDRIFEKIVKSKVQIQRFIDHCPESSLIFAISSFANPPFQLLEQFKVSVYQTEIKKHLQKFDYIFKEFLITYFVLEKKKTQSISELQREFIQYIIRQNYIIESQLVDLFPLHFIYSWLEFHFPELLSRLSDRFSILQLYTVNNHTKRGEEYEKILTQVLKHANIGGTAVAQFINSLSFDSTNESDKQPLTSDSASEVLVENRMQAERYFSLLEQKIFQYLVYGIIHWEDRIAGVPGIEMFILKFHQEYPERLKKLVNQIKLKYYPFVLERVERNFTKTTSHIFVKFYFEKELALRQQASVAYKDSILKIFFEKGIASWDQVIGNTIQYTESVIRSFYQQDPGYFIKLLKTFLGDNTEFIKRIELIYSSDFVSFIETVIKNNSTEQIVEQSIEERITEVPSDVDLIVYYLLIYEQQKKLPSNVAFSLHELVNYFVDHFPEQAKLYFVVAAYHSYAIVKQEFSTEVSSKIKKWIESSYENEKDSLKPEKANVKVSEEAQPIEINEPIYIVNAGLVLIHPFLQRFFSLCGLLEKRKFKDEVSSHKAVHLLHYIVTKLDHPEEHQTVLNKLLCGIPITEPIDRTIELTSEDKAFCESLIRGVIENWPILKKTSNENFRVSLLQREGRLTKEESTWRLKVEERSYDMLLDKLPWNISMIKLPWMEKMLQVEWH